MRPEALKTHPWRALVAELLNLVDRAYCYEAPDHWRLPIDTDQIPYRFARPVDQT